MNKNGGGEVAFDTLRENHRITHSKREDRSLAAGSTDHIILVEAYPPTDGCITDRKREVRFTQTLAVPAVWQRGMLADVLLGSSQLFLLQIPLQLEGGAWVAVQLEQHKCDSEPCVDSSMQAAFLATAQPLDQQQQVRLPICILLDLPGLTLDLFDEQDPIHLFVPCVLICLLVAAIRVVLVC